MTLKELIHADLNLVVIDDRSFWYRVQGIEYRVLPTHPADCHCHCILPTITLSLPLSTFPLSFGRNLAVTFSTFSFHLFSFHKYVAA